MPNKMVKLVLVIFLASVMILGFGGLCSKKKDKDTSAASSAPVVNSQIITMEGTLDGSTTQFAAVPQNGFWDKFCKLFSPLEAYAAGVDVNKVLAITYGEQGISLTEATKNVNSFSLSLTKGYPYIIVFINGTTNVLGLLKLDAATDLDALPLNNISSNIALGDVSYSGGEFQGTVSQTDLLNALGITSSLASAFGIMDEGMMRWCSLDADGNEVLDFTENREFQLTIDYGFNTGQDFDDITGTNFSVYTSTTFQGYMYYFSISPASTLGFVFNNDTCTATLHSPADINGGNDMRQGYFSESTEGDWQGMNFDFYVGESATDPVTPPPGTYTITVTNSSQTITKTYNFLNVKSQTITPTLENIYIPSIKLTMDSGKVTQLSWQWWKKTAGGWVQPTAEELSAVLENAGFEIGRWSEGEDLDEVRGSIGSPWEGVPFATSGTVAVGPQDFYPCSLRVTYGDKAGYNYGFEWR